MQRKLEDRLVAFAADCVFFIDTFPTTRVGDYYADQLLRASGSSALHYGEARGTRTAKDFIYKVSGTLKELKECQMILNILQYLEYGSPEKRAALKVEARELASIAAKMIINKKPQKN